MYRFWIHFAVLFAVMATVWPYFPTFLRAAGFDEAQVGYLQGIRMLCSAGGPLAVAWLSDRLGKRKLLLSACIVGFVVLAVPLSMTSSFWLAVPLVAGVGLTLRTTIPLSDTLAASELDDPAHQYGKVRIGGSLGFVGTLLGIRLLGLVDERSTSSMVTAMILAAAAAIVAVQLLPERRTPQPGDDDAKRQVKATFGAAFWIFLGAAALQQLGMSSYYAFFTIYLQDVHGMEQAAWVWALASAAEVPVLFYAGRITRRFSLTLLLAASMLAVSLRLGIYALVPFTGVVLAAQVLHAFAFGVFHASCIEFIRRRVPDARRALAMAFYSGGAVALPLLIGSSAGGLIIEHFGYATLYGAYALAPLLGVVVLVTGRGLVYTPVEAAEP